MGHEGGPRTVAVDGLDVHYERSGTGTPVVLLHGTGSSLRCFDGVAERLARRADVIRPDLPGFGRTGRRPDRDYRIATYTALLDHFLSALSVRRALVVGNSLGGNIAWNLALDAPAAVGGLVLINATGYPGKTLPTAMRLARNPVGRTVIRYGAGRAGVARSLRSSVGPRRRHVVTPQLVDRVHAEMSRPGNREAFIDLARTDQVDRSADVGSIDVPTLVLRSATIDGQHFARDIPHARERVHPDAGHLLPDEDPEWVADAVAEFLDLLAGSPDAPEGHAR